MLEEGGREAAFSCCQGGCLGSAGVTRASVGERWRAQRAQRGEHLSRVATAQAAHHQQAARRGATNDEAGGEHVGPGADAGAADIVFHVNPPSDEEIAAAQLVFICVGTPTRKDGGADLTQVDTVAAWVAKAVGRELILVPKSTVPVGTNVDGMEAILREAEDDLVRDAMS